MNSPHQREQLPDLLSDALSDAERERVESHLKQCPQCARELRALERMQHVLGTLPEATPPDSLRANVRAELRKDKRQLQPLAASLGKRAESKRAAPALSPRIGAPKALPFALPVRQLAWGGAVAVTAFGVMLLARPSLQNDAPTQNAALEETTLASRAASDQVGGSMTNSVITAKSETATANSPAVAAPGANRKSQPDASRSASGAKLPPSVPTQPENLPPIPKIEAPSFEPLPSLPSAPPHNNQRRTRPIPPTKRAPQSPAASSSPIKPFAPVAPPQVQQSLKPSLPQSSAPVANAPIANAPVAEDSLKMAGESNPTGRFDFAPSDSIANNNAASRSEASTPPAILHRALQAPARMAKSAADASPDWIGGAVEASLRRNEPSNEMSSARLKKAAPLILTVGVDKAIGNARLFLISPSGETQVWRGSLNAVPIEIKLNDLPNLRSGQKIRARLEQTNSEGNPKSSTTFSLLWP